jgi:hypothetical protein
MTKTLILDGAGGPTFIHADQIESITPAVMTNDVKFRAVVRTKSGAEHYAYFNKQTELMAFLSAWAGKVTDLTRESLG